MSVSRYVYAQIYYITLCEEEEKEREGRTQNRTSLTIPRDLILYERLHKMKEHNDIWQFGAEYSYK